MDFAKIWCACAALSAISGAQAGITFIEWAPTGDLTGILDLAPDGEWNYGDDYTYDAQLVTLDENWVGHFGDEVEFDIQLYFDEYPLRTPVPDISFNKSVTNNTNFFWSSFQIVLTPGMGTTLSDVFANPNSQFEDVMVSMGGGGSWTILWEQGMGTGVGIGETAMLDFGFNIDGNLGFMMKQTPIPAPAGVALFGAAGLAGLRRRR